MLSLNPIQDTATPEFSRAWALYEEAFPAEERRSIAQQRALLTNPAYQYLAIIYQAEFAGLLGVWQLSGFTFLEHFAVMPALRGKGVGKEALQALVKECRRPVILEVEPPLTGMAQRRISFYERAGFEVNDFEYWQPPYGVEKPWVKLWLMSYPAKVPAAALEIIKEQLYRRVYQQSV